MRDLLLGRQPKDFDIATEARPTQVKRTFPRNCRIIGRRFKLAHLHFYDGRKILEVSTFRRAPEGLGEEADLLITRDNEFGNAEEDARRRDFTVNALFFDPLADRIIDYVGGLQDVRDGVLRTIGAPIVRMREDTVRILRAAKFAGRLSLRLEPETIDAMASVAPDLTRSAAPRILEEILRLLRGGHALDSFQILRDIGALRVILPLVGTFLREAPEPERVVFWRLLEELDARIAHGTVVPTPVLLGALFTRPVLAALEQQPDRSPAAVTEALLGSFGTELRLSRRDAGCLKRICSVQPRFVATGGRAATLLRDPFFREALELFALSVGASGQHQELLADWRARAAEAGGAGAGPDDAEEGEGEEGEAMEAGASAAEPGRRRKRRRRGGRRRGRRERDDRDENLGAAAGDEPVDEPRPRGTASDAEFDADDAEPDDRADGGDAGELPESPGVLDELDLPFPVPSEAREGGAGADAGGTDGGRKRRRRGRRGGRRRRGGGNGEGERAEERAGEAPAPVRQAERREAPPARQPQPQARKPQEQKPKAQARQPEPRKKKDKPPRKRERERERERPREGGERRRHDGHRDRTVETIEPEAFDVSVFDREIDSRRVPTFGVLVDEGAAKKRRRAPRDQDDDYRPPPAPGSEPGPPPPPPKPSEGDDTYGDW